MRKIGGIHTFEDRAFLQDAGRMSLAVAVLGVAVGACWFAGVSALGYHLSVPLAPFELGTAFGPAGARLAGGAAAPAGRTAAWWLSLAAASVLSLAVHELVHGFFFRRFAPPGARVTFGANWKLGMLYASAEGIVYTRQQYLTISVAPSVVVTLLLVAIGVGLRWPLWTLVAATAHLAGCTGDWQYARTIRRNHAITHCEDTSWGVEFYGEGLTGAGPGAEADPALSTVPGAEPAAAVRATGDSMGGGAPVGDTRVDDVTPLDGAAPVDGSAAARVGSPSPTGASKGFSVVDGGKPA